MVALHIGFVPHSKFLLYITVFLALCELMYQELSAVYTYITVEGFKYSVCFSNGKARASRNSKPNVDWNSTDEHASVM